MNVVVYLKNMQKCDYKLSCLLPDSYIGVVVFVGEDTSLQRVCACFKSGLGSSTADCPGVR